MQLLWCSITTRGRVIMWFVMAVTVFTVIVIVSMKQPTTIWIRKRNKGWSCLANTSTSHLQPYPSLCWYLGALVVYCGLWPPPPNHIEKLNPAMSMGFHPIKIGKNKNENGMVWGSMSAHYEYELKYIN